MNAHVLMNLLNELGESDKMIRIPCILSLFRHVFHKFDSTGTQMLNSFHHTTSRLGVSLGVK